MLTILLHSSKTMRPLVQTDTVYQRPALIKQAQELDSYLKRLSSKQIGKAMHLSPKMAEKTHSLIQGWSDEPNLQRPAIDAFLGDIYSGLQVQTLSSDDRAYANQHLYILSGSYGVLKALDSIAPYRLEMGYTLPGKKYASLYKFWGYQIARQIPATSPIINLSATEYTKAVFPHLSNDIISPKFMTQNADGKPIFVTVHAKVARGAFAHWLIVNRVQDADELVQFTDLNYKFDATLSTPEQPVFVCDSFGGLGLSVRLT